jgi:HEPN domain-containing protein
LPRRTDASRPADWVDIAEADLAMVQLTAEREISFGPCRSKLAEALEKTLKAELIRLGWALEKTHDLQRLAKLLRERRSDLADSAHPLVSSLTEAYFSDRYPGFDLDDPDWPALRQQIADVSRLLDIVKARV